MRWGTHFGGTVMAVKQSLLSSTALAIFVAGAAFSTAWAQDTAPPADGDKEEEKVEKVTVTGSRLKKDEFSSTSPVQIIDPKTAEKKGDIDTAQTIQSAPIAAGSAQVTSAISSAFVTNGGPGTSTVSLRGLGAERTLVLLNGRRVGPAGVRGAVGAVDLNVIPQSMISSVEVLKDGASSIYGSDAVAGVVNIITKRGGDDGLTLNSFLSQPFESGGEEYRLSGSGGVTTPDEKGYIQLGVDYYKRNELKRGDREYLNCPEEYIFDTSGARNDINDARTGRPTCRDTLWGHVWVYDYTYLYTANPSNLVAPNGNPIRRFQFNYAGDNLGTHIPTLTALTGPTGGDPALITVPAGWFPVGYNAPSFGVENAMHPFISDSTVIPETTRYTAYLDGAYKFADEAELYVEGLLNRRKTYQNGYRQFWQFGFSENFDTAGFGDPFATGFSGSMLISPTAITDHSDTSQQVDYARGVIGMRGDVGSLGDVLFRNLSYDVHIQYSRSSAEYSSDQILDDAVDSQDFRTGSCVGTFTPISNRPCIDINWVDPELLRGNIPQSVRNFLFAEETGHTDYTQKTYEGVVTGDFAEIWAGTIGFALGATVRTDEINDTPGDITLANNAWGNTGAGITKGKSETAEVFGELDIPLLKDAVVAKSLTLSLAGRHTQVSTIDGNGDETYKIGANWAVNDWLRFRGSYGTSFRAPHLFELFLADQTSFIAQRNIDPCIQWQANLLAGNISAQTAANCAADGVPPAFNGGAITATVITGGGLGVLDPETSVAKSVSVILTPNEFLPDNWRASLAVDYYEIEVNGEITQLGAANILGGCYSSNLPFPNDPLCSLFTRNNDIGVLVDPNAVATVRDSFLNINSQVNRGIDVTVRLGHDLPGDLGSLSLLAQMGWQLQDTVALFAGVEQSVNGESGEPKWVGDFNLSWEGSDGWSAFYGLDVIGSTSDVEDFVDANGGPCVASATRERTYCPKLTAPTTFYHSISATKEIEDWQLTLGVANLLDEAPPRVSTANVGQITTVGQAPFTSNYDFVGRRGFLSVTKRF
jgi:iron complex outermembrane recepter protein